MQRFKKAEDENQDSNRIIRFTGKMAVKLVWVTISKKETNITQLVFKLSFYECI